MVIADTYPFLEIFWTMLIFFGFVIWVWILITVIADVLRRDDASGWVKAAWIAFVVILPLMGVLIYLIAEHRGMTERAVGHQQEVERDTAEYVRSVAARTDPAQQIRDAKGLLDEGAITASEYEAIKRRALSHASDGGADGAPTGVERDAGSTGQTTVGSQSQ